MVYLLLYQKKLIALQEIIEPSKYTGKNEQTHALQTVTTELFRPTATHRQTHTHNNAIPTVDSCHGSHCTPKDANCNNKN